MIITRQTGSYKTILPKVPSDSGNVVYVISGDPPRSDLNFNQIPTGITIRQRMMRDPDISLRRENLGAFILTDKSNNPNRVSKGNQLFYVGQVSGFENVVADEIEQINADIEILHDQHFIDSTHIDLTDSQLLNIEQSATVSQKQVFAELEELQKQQRNLEIEIVDQQKIINECNRVLNGIAVIINNDSNNQSVIEVQQQVNAKRLDAEKLRQEAVLLLQAIPEQVRSKQDELRALAVLIN